MKNGLEVRLVEPALVGFMRRNGPRQGPNAQDADSPAPLLHYGNIGAKNWQHRELTLRHIEPWLDPTQRQVAAGYA